MEGEGSVGPHLCHLLGVVVVWRGRLQLLLQLGLQQHHLLLQLQNQHKQKHVRHARPKTSRTHTHKDTCFKDRNVWIIVFTQFNSAQPHAEETHSLAFTHTYKRYSSGWITLLSEWGYSLWSCCVRVCEDTYLVCVLAFCRLLQTLHLL